MPYKTITDRLKLSLAVEHAIDKNAEDLAATLLEGFEPYLEEGEESPDLVLPLRLLGRRLADNRERMARAEERHLEELDDDHEPRRRRDEIAARLRRKLLAIRSGFDAIYGQRRAVEVIGLEGRIAQDALALLRQGKRVGNNLREAEPVERPPEIEGFAFDMATLLQEIEADCAALEQAFEDIHHEKRQAERTLIAKNRMARDFDDLLSATASCLDGWFRLGGEEELAERVRPAIGRPGRPRNKPDDEEEESAPEADAKPVAQPAAEAAATP